MVNAEDFTYSKGYLGLLSALGASLGITFCCAPVIPVLYHHCRPAFPEMSYINERIRPRTTIFPSRYPVSRVMVSSKREASRLSAYDTTDINDVPIDDSTVNKTVKGTELVGAGESWLDLEGNSASHPTTGIKTSYMKSLVVATETPMEEDIYERIDRIRNMVGVPRLA